MQLSAAARADVRDGSRGKRSKGSAFRFLYILMYPILKIKCTSRHFVGLSINSTRNIVVVKSKVFCKAVREKSHICFMC